MSDVSTVTVDAGCAAFPKSAWDRHFQTKNLPEHESETACINGTIRSDGMFIRHDDLWNPSLHGWIGMRSEMGSEMFLCVRFASGKAVEVIEHKMPFNFDGPMAWESQNDWCQIPITLE